MCAAVGGASFGGATSRQRVTPVSPHPSRFDESLEARSYDNAHHYASGGGCGGIPSRSKPLFRLDMTAGIDILSDSSGRSLESIHVVFEDVEKLSESLKEHQQRLEEEISVQGGQSSTAAIPIPLAPGQLTQAFHNLATSPVIAHNTFARSAPVPVPKHPLAAGSSVSRCPLMETEKFVPPHVLADRMCNCDPIRREIRGTCRGLSSLRARNAIFAQLGYFDGSLDTSSPPSDTSGPKQTPMCLNQDW